MTNQQHAQVAAQGFLPSFAPSFLEDHARRLVNDPQIALVELVANCWDAGADQVLITWPAESKPAPIEIKDNGTGMSYEQFIERWRQLNYNRKKAQGEDVVFPSDNQSSHRKAFGKNGKGRHSMFCFADEYFVETWRDGQANRFKIRWTPNSTQAPYVIEPVKQFFRDGHGTIISAELARNYIKLQSMRDLIGSKFITDPTFRVFVNDTPVELTSLDHLIDVQEVQIAGVGTVKVSQVDTQKTSRTSHPHGIAWWVNKRLVGEPSWKDFDEDGFLDRRTIEAKRYTFVVEADILADEVEEDWSGFRDTEKFKTSRSTVEEHIRHRLAELMKDVHKSRKKAVLEDNVDSLANLSIESRYFIGKTIDGIQERIP